MLCHVQVAARVYLRVFFIVFHFPTFPGLRGWWIESRGRNTFRLGSRGLRWPSGALWRVAWGVPVPLCLYAVWVPYRLVLRPLVLSSSPTRCYPGWRRVVSLVGATP